MSIGKFIGCMMIVVGSAIGAGILAMPMVSASAGFVTITTVILFLWVLLTASGLLVVELSCALPIHACSFNSMAEKTLGPFGRSVTWISCSLLLYSTLAAYIAGESSIIVNTLDSFFRFKMSTWVSAILLTVVLGMPVFLGTKAVDYLNRALIGAKGGLLIVTLFFIMFYIDADNLLASDTPSKTKAVFSAIPVLMCIFNYHFVIPSLRIYVGDKKNVLRWIVVSGTTLSLVVYLLWLIGVLGVVPLTGDNSFASINQGDSSVGEFIRVLTTIVQSKWAKFSINSFANISMTTSFLGISLGLFDFLADGFKRSDDFRGRLQTAGLTFIPPFIFALFYPEGFVTALSYSAVFISILFLMLPVIMIHRLQKVDRSITIYGGVYRLFFALMVVIGFGFSVLPILKDMGIFKVVA